MKTRIIATLLLSVGFVLNAQNGYEFAVSNQPYEDLVGSTSLNNGQIWDEDAEYVISLGFNFQIDAYDFDTIYIPEAFAGGVLSSNPNDVGTGPLIVPIGQDLIDLGFTTGTSLTNVSYKTEGAQSERILKIEWKNVGFYGDMTNSDYCNIQIWLYEGSNAIEYRYGPSQINDPYNSYDGETGPIVALLPSYNFGTDMILADAYFLSGDPVDPTVITFGAGEEPQEAIALVGTIADGTVYTFSPRVLSTESFDKVDFVVYPNPAKDYLHIQTNANDYEVAIYNNIGQEIKYKTNIDGTLDVLNLSNGVYFVEIETIYGKATKKFIKI